jgi:predicted DNA-binding protein YlxM (UPF0122 family)
MTKTITTIKYRNLGSFSSAERWELLKAYIDGKNSMKEIQDTYQIKAKALESFISETYAAFRQARETKMLIATQGNPELFKSMTKQYVDGETINEPFLSKLSPDEGPLTEAEILFSEFLLEYGDAVKALKKAKLHLGLKRSSKVNVDGKEDYKYIENLRIRCFYLKKKPNVARYINEQNRKNLSVLKDGKEFIQSNAIALIEQLKANNDLRYLPSQIKAIELFGRTIGAFDDKLTIDSTNGDDVLDAMIAKAKDAKVSKPKPMLAYSSEDGGTEVYE